MAKKKTVKKKNLTKEVKDATRKVWLAGLGALAAAEEEGTKAFKTLVKRGGEFERRNRPKVTRSVKSAGGQVKKVWDKVGDSFEAQVAGVLTRLGVPGREEWNQLNRRLDHLEAGTKKKKPTAKRKPAARRSAKKPPARKRS